jgi:hypothetical protein
MCVVLGVSLADVLLDGLRIEPEEMATMVGATPERPFTRSAKQHIVESLVENIAGRAADIAGWIAANSNGAISGQVLTRRTETA